MTFDNNGGSAPEFGMLAPAKRAEKQAAMTYQKLTRTEKEAYLLCVGRNAMEKANKINAARRMGSDVYATIAGDPFVALDGEMPALAIGPKWLAEIIKGSRPVAPGLTGPEAKNIHLMTDDDVSDGEIMQLAAALQLAAPDADIANNGITIPRENIDIYVDHAGGAPGSGPAIEASADGTPYHPEELAELMKMNKQFTQVVVGGKQRVVTTKPCPIDGTTHSFEALGEFHGYFFHRKKIGRTSMDRAWLAWPGKNFKPDGVGFYPDPDKCPGGVFNLFTGIAIKPKQGDVEPYLTHLRDVICAGEPAAFKYLIGWLAHLVQKPDEKPSVAVVMKSVEGAGKGSTFKPLKAIFGPHAIQVNGYRQIAGRFNSTVANKLLVFGDEVDLSSQAVADRLKGLISERTINLERKGIDPEPMPNYARFIFASNGDHVISAGTRERRYLVLEPSQDKAQDKAYFNRLHDWADGEGPAALLHFLKGYDISDFDPRRAPTTRALIGEKLASMKPADAYIYSQLTDKEPFGGVNRMMAADLVDKFYKWSADNVEVITMPAARSSIGKAMERASIHVKGRSDREGKYYDFPSLDEMREGFAKSMGHEVWDIF